MFNLNVTALVVTGGLVVICITSLITKNDLIATASLAALAGWLGGNSNGKKSN